jgi:hypothetical protein
MVLLKFNFWNNYVKGTNAGPAFIFYKSLSVQLAL